MWVNGFPLGRYWESQGPQHTLFVPAPVLQLGLNTLMVGTCRRSAAVTHAGARA